MSGLIILISFILLVFVGYFLTRNVKKIILRWTLSLSFPFAVFFCFYPGYLLSLLTKTIYCYFNESKVNIYTSPVEWKANNREGVTISPKIDFTQENRYLHSNPKSYDFEYNTQILLNKNSYKLRFINKKNPIFALYENSEINVIWGRNTYLYYDVVLKKPIISINDYYTKYDYPLTDTFSHCYMRDEFSILDNYIDVNYLEIKQ